MTVVRSYYFLFVLALVFTACKDNPAKSVHIFVASGLRAATEELCAGFERETNIKVVQNYASTGTLARQISNGAEADLFLAASKDWMDYLEQINMLEDSTIIPLVRNKLVVISALNQLDMNIDFSRAFDILSVVPDKIAIGDPSYVPVGRYTMEVFDKLHWRIPLAEKMILTKDVTSVVHVVELGECDWGIVYYTEGRLSPKVKIVCEIPEHLHSPIVFYMAQLKSRSEMANAFYKYMISEKGKQVFVKHGYLAAD